MKNYLLGVAIFMALDSTVLWASSDLDLTVANKEEKLVLIALETAYDSMQKARLSVDNRTVVIRHVNDTVIISFLFNPNQRKYGGSVHLTYEIAAGKIVDIYSEE